MASSAPLQQHGVRRIPHQPGVAAPNAVAAPRAADQRLATSTAPLLANFNGVSSTAGSTAFGPVTVAAAGTGSYGPNATR